MTCVVHDVRPFDVGRNIPSGCPSLADGSTVRNLSVDGGDL